MKHKHLHITPKIEAPTYEGALLGVAIVRRYREIIESDEAPFNTDGIKVMKRELAMTVRQENGNVMCMANIASIIDDAVAEYVDGFVQNLQYKDDEYCTYLLTRLVRRIEDDVMHVKRIVKS